MSQPTYQVGDVANGYVLGEDGQWHPMPAPYPAAPDGRTSGTKVAVGVLVGLGALLLVAAVAVGVVAVLLSGTAEDSTGTPAEIAAGEEPLPAPGPTTVVEREDFATGSGPFGTGSDGTSSVTVVDGLLRIVNSDPEWSAESYAELAEPVSSLAITTAVTITEPLRAEEGPALSVSRGEELLYEFQIDGSTAYLWELTGEDDYRLLDSATLPQPVTGTMQLGLEVVAEGDGRIVGTIDGEPVVLDRGVTGTYDTASLIVWSDGQPRTVDFDWVELRA
jgi:predicted secreted protein